MSGKPHGLFNAEKCIQYLRWIGVEIDDATATAWIDTQKVHRLLASMKRTVAQGWDWWCVNGHQQYLEQRSRRGKRRERKPDRCPICGGRWSSGKARWYEARDGTIKDLRPKDERWKALGLATASCRQRPSTDDASMNSPFRVPTPRSETP